LTNIPKSLLYKYFRLKSFKVNGKRANAETVLCEGDIITLYISDEFFPDAGEAVSESEKYADTRLDLEKNEIVYEDENIIIIDKPQGETVHPSEPDEQEKNGERFFLIDRVTGYLFKKGEYIPENEQSFTPSLCHRLDRNTGGLIICAKNAQTLRIMNEKIRNREIKKTYFLDRRICFVCEVAR
jgi:23S rRNA pseudouridine955/2504/2580 synthase